MEWQVRWAVRVVALLPLTHAHPTMAPALHTHLRTPEAPALVIITVLITEALCSCWRQDGEADGQEDDVKCVCGGRPT